MGNHPGYSVLDSLLSGRKQGGLTSDFTVLVLFLSTIYSPPKVWNVSVSEFSEPGNSLGRGSGHIQAINSPSQPSTWQVSEKSCSGCALIFKRNEMELQHLGNNLRKQIFFFTETSFQNSRCCNWAGPQEAFPEKTSIFVPRLPFICRKTLVKE